MAHPRWLDTDEKRAWNAFVSTHALLSRRLDQQLKRDTGFSHLQYEIMARLSGAPDRELRMTELAGEMFNSKSGLTYQITQLEQAGLVRRRECNWDSRAVYAGLTDEGMAFLERTAPAHVALVRELLFDVLTPEQVTAIADGLGEASRRMRGCGGDAPAAEPQEASECGGAEASS